MMAVQERIYYQSQQEETGSKAFPFEGEKKYSHSEIYDDIVSYLGEYRFKLPKFNYSFLFSEGQIKSSVGQEPMTKKARRAIEKNQTNGDPIKRELAELGGMLSLENQLRSAQIGDRIFWGSPPGPKEEGYGSYGFIFDGMVEAQNHISMTAIRVEKPSLERYSAALSVLTGYNLNFQSPEDCLKNPLIVKGRISVQFVDDVLRKYFEFKPDTKEQERFKSIITRMQPLIHDLTELIQTGSPIEKKKAFQAVENYFIELEEESRGESEMILYSKDDPRLIQIIPDYSYKPPVVMGSCGSTEKQASSNLFGFNSIFKPDLKDILDKTNEMKCVTCPFCGETVDAIITADKITCPECKQSAKKSPN
jgi:hypothetical protein